MIARIASPDDTPKGPSAWGSSAGEKAGSAMTRASTSELLVTELSDVTYERAAPAISNGVGMGARSPAALSTAGLAPELLVITRTRSNRGEDALPSPPLRTSTGTP